MAIWFEHFRYPSLTQFEIRLNYCQTRPVANCFDNPICPTIQFAQIRDQHKSCYEQIYLSERGFGFCFFVLVILEFYLVLTKLIVCFNV